MTPRDFVDDCAKNRNRSAPPVASTNARMELPREKIPAFGMPLSKPPEQCPPPHFPGVHSGGQLKRLAANIFLPMVRSSRDHLLTRRRSTPLRLVPSVRICLRRNKLRTPIEPQ